jgi:hypothetical protein
MDILQRMFVCKTWGQDCKASFDAMALWTDSITAVYLDTNYHN